jgi:two-component system, sensor histidine kinase and response regulator
MKLSDQNKNGPAGKLHFYRSNGTLHNPDKSINSLQKQISVKSKSVLKQFKILVAKGVVLLNAFWKSIVEFHDKVCSFGISSLMDESVKRRLLLLNQINILHFITCLIIPFLVLFNNKNISFVSFLISLAPCFVSVLVLALNAVRKFDAALLTYFILYPFFTCLIYLDGMDLGMELYFIMYGILAVFFLQEISHMLFSVGFSMISYFMLAVVLKKFTFSLEMANPTFFYFNQIVAIVFIFYGLYLIKKENTGYQGFILKKNEELNEVNVEIEKKNQIISEKADQLEKQTVQLTELNAFKNKLFSIISHDMRAPVYALRDLFKNAAEKRLSTQELEELIPDVATDLSNTTDLMENLLQWAKSQMDTKSVIPQMLDISIIAKEVTQLLRLQAEAKNIHIVNTVTEQVGVYADRDMVHLVLRNILSNAIKFTPQEGKIIIGMNEAGSFAEVFVRDSGMGMSPEALLKINANNYFTTKGTANEAGTGLGLMLCKEFIAKNGGKMFVESEEGKGSTFSFTLPIGD